PVLIERGIEQHPVGHSAVEITDPEGAPVPHLTEPCRIAGYRPAQCSVAVEAPQRPVLEAWIIEQDIITRLAVEVTDPEWIVRYPPEPRRIARLHPAQLSAYATLFRSPVLINRGIEQHPLPPPAVKITDPEGPPIPDLAEPGGVAGL